MLMPTLAPTTLNFNGNSPPFEIKIKSWANESDELKKIATIFEKVINKKKKKKHSSDNIKKKNQGKLVRFLSEIGNHSMRALSEKACLFCNAWT